MMKKIFGIRLFSCLAAFLLLAGGVFVEESSALDLSSFKGELAIGNFMFDPSGSHSYSSASKKGESLDIDNQMNISGDNAFYGRIKLEGLGSLPGVSFNGRFLQSDGTGNTTTKFQYGDKEFNIGNYDAEITLNTYDIAAFYHLKGITTATLGKVKVDIGGAFRWFDAEVAMSQKSGPDMTVDETDYTASLYADLLVRPFKGLELGIEWRGLSFSDTKFSNITLRANYEVMESMFFGGGYVFEKMEVDQEGMKFELDTEGAFLEAGIRF